MLTDKATSQPALWLPLASTHLSTWGLRGTTRKSSRDICWFSGLGYLDMAGGQGGTWTHHIDGVEAGGGEKVEIRGGHGDGTEIEDGDVGEGDEGLITEERSRERERKSSHALL